MQNRSTPKPTGSDPISRADTDAMSAAIDAAESARLTSRPNPWVGAAVVDSSGAVIATGATEPVGGRHAEVVA
ncbi:MAG: hypothetical protein VW962_08400, partial [Acidimicrobiaceae bacterium]